MRPLSCKSTLKRETMRFDEMKRAALLFSLLAAAVVAYRLWPDPPRAQTPSGMAWLKRGLTHRGPPWEEERLSLLEYMRSHGLTPRAVVFTGGVGSREPDVPGAVCRSLDCPSGRSLQILVHAAEVSAAAKLGFGPSPKPPFADEASRGPVPFP